MKAIPHDSIHTFFQSFSRIIIILPVIIVVFAILLKMAKTDNSVIESKIIPIPTTTQRVSPSIVPTNTIFDLQGPLTCFFQTKETSWSAIIQKRVIVATASDKIKITYYLMKDDCLYIWEKQKYSGEKICGVGQFISIGEGLLNSGLMNESMFDMLLNQSKINASLPFQLKDIKKMIATCKPSEVFPLSQFALPKQVLFKSR